MGENDKAQPAKEGNKCGSAFVSALIIGVVGLGIGIALGMFLPNETDELISDVIECKEKQEAEAVLEELEEGASKSKVDSILDALMKSKDLNEKNKAFYWKSLSAQRRMQMVFISLVDTDLADYVAAQKNWHGGEPIVKNVPVDRVKEIYKKFFGEEPSEEDFVSYLSCGELAGKFKYNSAESRYEISYVAGCGSNNAEPDDYYFEKYEKRGDVIYVTAAFGSVATQGERSYVMNDLSGGVVVEEFDFDELDFVNEATKDKFTKYQFVFDNKDGEWVLRGLYPLGVE